MKRGTKKTETSGQGAEASPINMQLRIANDGGPLHAYLASLDNAHYRAERFRQLAYLGLMAERRVFSDTPVAPVMTGAMVQPASKAVETKPSEAPPPTTGPDHVDFDMDDVAAVFGGSEAKIGG